MSLPSVWIDSLFARLSIRYGAAFMRQYADLDAESVKADWADVLGGFHDKPEAIKYGLEHLPSDKPVSSLVFRDICRRAPDAAVKLLERPIDKPSPEVVARVAAVGVAHRNEKDWAHALKRCELENGGWLPNGQKMTRASREMWRTALEVKE